MANKKSVGHAYNVDFLNVVFAASSLFLFFTTIWMVFDDFDREWKGYQRQFVLLEGYVTSLELQAEEAGIDQTRLSELNNARVEAEQALASNQAQVDELNAELADIDAQFYITNQAYNFLKAEYDVERYAYEELQTENPEEAIELRPNPGSIVTRKILGNIKFPDSSIIGSINHRGHVSIPHADTQISDEDSVLVFSLPSAISKVEKLFD